MPARELPWPIGRCEGVRCPSRRMFVLKPGQRYHPLCDPDPQAWLWPVAERLAYLARARTRPTLTERTP